MKRSLLVTVVAIAFMVMGAGQSDASMTGRVVTCPGGENMANRPVRIYKGVPQNLIPEHPLVYITTVTTNQNGNWEYANSSPGYYTASLIDPPFLSYRTCWKSRYELVGWPGLTRFPNLEFECGTPKTPPCPHPE